MILLRCRAFALEEPLDPPRSSLRRRRLPRGRRSRERPPLAAAQPDGSARSNSAARSARATRRSTRSSRGGFSDSDQVARAADDARRSTGERGAWQLFGEIMDSRRLGQRRELVRHGTTTSTRSSRSRRTPRGRIGGARARCAIGRVTLDLGKRRLVAPQPVPQHRQHLHGRRLVMAAARGPRRARVLLDADAASCPPTSDERARQRLRARPRLRATASLWGGSSTASRRSRTEHALEAYVLRLRAPKATAEPLLAASTTSRSAARACTARRKRPVELRGRGRAADRRLGRQRRRRRTHRPRSSRVVCCTPRSAISSTRRGRRT